MKQLFGMVLLSLFLSSSLFAGVTTGYKKGKGPLKVTKDTANIIEYFFSGGKNGVYAKEQKEAWKPGLMAISVDGVYDSFIKHPLRVTQVDGKAYWGMVIAECKKKSEQECYLFANGYKIVWDNGSNKKKRRLKKKDIRAGKTIALLTELGFFDNNTSSSTITPKDIEKHKAITKKETATDKDIVKKLKELKELLDTGVLSKEEFEKAKKKLLN